MPHLIIHLLRPAILRHHQNIHQHHLPILQQVLQHMEVHDILQVLNIHQQVQNIHQHLQHIHQVHHKLKHLVQLAITVHLVCPKCRHCTLQQVQQHIRQVNILQIVLHLHQNIHQQIQQLIRHKDKHIVQQAQPIHQVALLTILSQKLIKQKYY